MQNKTQNIISKVKKNQEKEVNSIQKKEVNSIQEKENTLKEIEYLLQCSSIECGW